MSQIAEVEHDIGGSPPTNLERELQDWSESFTRAKEG